MLRKDRVKGFAYCALRHGKARADRIGAVAHERQNALLSKLRKPLKVSRLSEYRRIVDLEVSRVDDDARRCENSQRGCIHDTVIGLYELHAEASQIDGLSVFNHLSLNGAQHIVLFQFMLNQPDSQLRPVYRRRNILQHVGQGADVILMSVRDHKTLHLVNIVFQVGDIRNYQVNSQHIIAREGKSAVHYNNTVLVLEGRHVHSDLLQASERNNFYLVVFRVLFQINYTSAVLFNLNSHVAHQFIKNSREVVKLAVLLYKFIYRLGVLWF